MGLRSATAKAASGFLSWGLHNIARRPGAQLPGKVALKIDPAVVRELRRKMRDGSVVVVGTNGKTTVTNLLADVLEKSGRSVLCNRTGANLKSGIATALLQGRPSNWGVIECDELWLAKVLPDLRATWVLLLDLFRDQLDRCGELDRIQESIVGALMSSPETGLVYNADDPLCTYVARRVAEERESAGLPPLHAVSFGVGESMNLAQNAVADATMCQVCFHMFEYDYRQYGQLGAYKCTNCGFERPSLDFVARDIDLTPEGLSFEIERSDAKAESPSKEEADFKISAHLAGTYNVYNLLAVYSCASMVGCSGEDVQAAVNEFDPKNGRLQRYIVDGRHTLLNLAKNPTGFNQNLRIVAGDKGPHAVAFFINDQVVDGHDISWIWDIDFEELVAQPNVKVFAGGSRRNDLQVRLKYAGVKAQLVDGIEDVYETLRTSDDLPSDAPVYAIANYSALPPVHRALNSMTEKLDGANAEPNPAASKDELKEGASEKAGSEDIVSNAANRSEPVQTSGGEEYAIPTDMEVDIDSVPSRLDTPSCSVATPIVIAYILPDLLNLYGDGGNVRILEQRLRWRGIPVEVRRLKYGDPIELDDVDLVFLGGGPDREQKLATEQLVNARGEIARYIDEGGPLLAICGGYQILGRTWLLGDDEVPGLGIFGMETRRPGTSADRLIGNIALRTPIAEMPVIGFENHAGRTYLDDGVLPFGEVASHSGFGNNDDSSIAHADGVRHGNVIGTYLHGTLLAKNPEVADWLLARALERHALRTGEEAFELIPLDDVEEQAANAFMAKKLI